MKTLLMLSFAVFIASIFTLAGWFWGTADTERIYKPRIAALDKQLDMVVEMQNMQKDAYDLSTQWLKDKLSEAEGRCK